MKYFIDIDESGNVTGIFRNMQRAGQPFMDEGDSKILAYKQAKLSRASSTAALVERITKLETDLAAVKSAEITIK